MTFNDGDLTELTLVEHDSIDKKFCVMGKFKGIAGEHILARIGEGPDDIRDFETIRMTAEYVLKEIQDIYALNAYIKSRKDIE